MAAPKLGKGLPCCQVLKPMLLKVLMCGGLLLLGYCSLFVCGVPYAHALSGLLVCCACVMGCGTPESAVYLVGHVWWDPMQQSQWYVLNLHVVPVGS